MGGTPEGISPASQEMVRDRGDLLGYPAIGRILRSPKFITSLQVVSLVLFVTAVYQGFVHSDIEDNLFTTGLFWGLFWPLFIFITTPVFGKVICMVCPHRLLIFRLAARFSLNRRPPGWMTEGYVSLLFVMLFYWLLIYTWPGVFHNSFNTAVYFTVFTILSLLVTLLFRPDTWCRGMCPVAVPTNLVSRTAFLGLRTYGKVCGSCRKATCVAGRPGFEGCPHGINPSLLKDNSDCTLCMKCINSCSHDAVRFGFVRPLGEFRGKKLKADMPEALGVVLLLGALTFTMQLYNGIYRGAMRDKFPLYKAASALDPWLGQMISIDGMVGLLTFTFSVAFAFLYFRFFSFTSSRISGKATKEAFAVMAWCVLPLFAFSSLAQMSEFFFFRYYPMIANGFLDLFGFRPGVRPLVGMSSPWLFMFKLISLAGGVWSIAFTWRLSGRLSEDIPARVGISLPFWVLHLLILSAFVAHVVVMFFLDMPQITGPRGVGFG